MNPLWTEPSSGWSEVNRGTKMHRATKESNAILVPLLERDWYNLYSTIHQPPYQTLVVNNKHRRTQEQ